MALPDFRRRLASLARPMLLGLGAALLAGCQSPVQVAATPDTPWSPGTLPDARPLTLTPIERPSLAADTAAPSGTAATWAGSPSTAQVAATPAPPARFPLPVLTPAGQTAPLPENLPSHPLTLPELIDLAQRINPITRIAWEQARQAAQAVGMAEALFLPQITAAVVAGQQRSKIPLPLAIGSIDSVETTVRGVIPAITLQWLLFDFGEHDAIIDGARHLAFGANVQFQAAHQRLIQAVALAYYPYEASRARTIAAAEALKNSEAVAEAVSARRRGGVATILEEAQARQMVAQGRLLLVQAQGLERDAYQVLIAAVGLPPTSKPDIASLPQRPLPTGLADDVQQRLQEILAQRPEVLTAFAAAQAAQRGVDAAEAAFLPKVFLTAITAVTNTRLNVSGLSMLGQPVSHHGVMVGVTLPLYDGGLRSSQLHSARSRADQAIEIWREAQQAAALDVVVADNRLRSALQAEAAAAEWVNTAQTMYDAALEAYQHGLGTVTVAAEANTGLLAARMAEVDAKAAAHAAATLLAHATGQLTSSADLP